MPNNKIIIPGCEPTSAVTSITLMRNQTCCGAVVELQEALEAIPGSYVEYGKNYGVAGASSKWLVIPFRDPECPCVSGSDWYKILKDLACVPENEITDFEPCLVSSFGACPDPDFKTIPDPPTSTYFEEGLAPAGMSFMPAPTSGNPHRADPYL